MKWEKRKGRWYRSSNNRRVMIFTLQGQRPYGILALFREKTVLLPIGQNFHPSLTGAKDSANDFLDGGAYTKFPLSPESLEVLSIPDPQVEILGGPTSGHRRHKGIPGYKGGSMPGSGQANVFALRAAAEKGKEAFEVINDVHPRGAYESHRIRIKGDGDVILKPSESLSPSDVELVQNEVAAYEISEKLGFEMVPPTTRIEGIKNADGEIVPASIQSWVSDSETGFEYTRTANPEIAELRKLVLFDAVINNLDRNGGNWLVKDGKVVGIDHGLSLCEFPGSHFSDLARSLATRTKTPKLTLLPKERVSLSNALKDKGFWDSLDLAKNKKYEVRKRVEYILDNDGFELSFDERF